MQEAGESHLADPVFLRNSMEGGRPSSLDEDGQSESPGQPLLGRSVSVTVQNTPSVAKKRQEFRTAFQAEIDKVSTFYLQETQKLLRDIDTLANSHRALSATHVRPACTMYLHCHCYPLLLIPTCKCYVLSSEEANSLFVKPTEEYAVSSACC